MERNLISVFALKKQAENKTDNGGCFLVYYPVILVVRVFHIAVGGFGGDRLSTHAVGLNAGFSFLLMSFAYHSDMILKSLT